MNYRNSVSQARHDAEMARSRETREQSEFGRRMALARSRTGLSGLAAAKLLDVPQPRLSDAEGSQQTCSFLARAALVYQVDPIWLEMGEGEAPDMGVRVNAVHWRDAIKLKSQQATNKDIDAEVSRRVEAGIRAMMQAALGEENTPKVANGR